MQGFISIYDKAPHDEFWLFHMLSEGDVTKHKKLFDTPIIWVYATADKKIKENKEQERRMKQKPKR